MRLDPEKPLAPMARVACGSLALLLVACGGGGSSTPPPPPPLVLTPTSVSATAVEGQQATVAATATLDAQVDVSGTVYLRLSYDESVIDVDVSGTVPRTGTITLTASRDLPVGDHTGSVDVLVCKTDACTEHYSSTPATLTYRITITPAPPAATVTPTSLTKSVEAGDPFEITVTADLASHISSYVFFAASDPQGRFAATPALSVGSSVRTYSVTLTGAPIDVLGTYTGTLDLIICYSSSCTMSADVPGSPIAIPYTITVTPAPALDPIPTITGLPEWETFQGNPEHTGHVPVTLNAASFTSGWSWTSPFPNTILSPVTAGSGLAVVSATGRFSEGFLFALHETDGATAWQHDFGSIHAVNHPAASAGRVFVATSGHQDTAMWSFELATGRQVFRTPFASQWEHYLAPTFKDGVVYTNGGYYGGMYAFKGTSGAQRWFAGLAQYDLWSPAVDDTYAYAHTGYEWVALNRATGERAFDVQNNGFNWRGYSLNIAPVIDTPDSIVVVDGVYDYASQHDNHLIRYSISGRNELWRVNGRFATNPAAAHGNIYVMNAATRALEVFDATNGTRLWAWTTTDDVPVGNLIVTESHVFLRTSTATHAIDIATRQSVWSTPRTGHLALSSNSVLYIVAPSTIDTFDLL